MSLDYGFSKALLLRWASGGANTILLTGRGHGTTTARNLLAKMEYREKVAETRAAAKAAAAASGGVVVVGARSGGAGVGVGAGEDDGEDDGDEEDEEAPLVVEVKVGRVGSGVLGVSWLG